MIAIMRNVIGVIILKRKPHERLTAKNKPGNAFDLNGRADKAT